MANVQMKKSNRVITVDATQAKGYLARGYDQIDDNGRVTKEATSGKVINPADYARVLKELETLKARQLAPTDINFEPTFKKLQEDYDKLEKSYHALSEGNEVVSQEDHDDLQSRYDDLEAKAKEFAEKGKALKEENDKLKKRLNNK